MCTIVLSHSLLTAIGLSSLHTRLDKPPHTVTRRRGVCTLNSLLFKPPHTYAPDASHTQYRSRSAVSSSDACASERSGHNFAATLTQASIKSMTSMHPPFPHVASTTRSRSGRDRIPRVDAEPCRASSPPASRNLPKALVPFQRTPGTERPSLGAILAREGSASSRLTDAGVCCSKRALRRVSSSKPSSASSVGTGKKAVPHAPVAAGACTAAADAAPVRRSAEVEV